MGPGPIDADPRVLAAMSRPLIGQFDPAMTGLMERTMALYRGVFRTANEATLVVDGTSRAGIEACLVSLLRPGDPVLVLVMGRFGHLLKEIAERCGATVRTVEVPWGGVVPAEAVEEAILRKRPVLVATVQGDTSTTMNQPLADLGEVCRRHDVLLYADVTASIGGNPLELDAWGVDVASAGLQKCLAGPPGSAPVSLSGRAVERVRSRHSVEAGIQGAGLDDELPPEERIRSNYFDLGMVLDYWGPLRLNHHTEATSMLYAAFECARILLEEGVDAAVERHRLHGAAMAAGLRGLGLSTYGDDAHRMHNVVGVHIPDGVDADAVRADLLAGHGIEIGTSFGPLHGRIWRIGTMGYNAREDAVLRTLDSLEAVLSSHGVAVPTGGGTDAAVETYGR
ncbi:pyridoxal-phosphate-dependent aminotransferase family protein [Dermatobacter hominis]|uniref:pyridoxal-phosphate-dependent aminotransferase family protein n=1 Tax=Dermatobacter hominis TaxID=2884263 RepID=UPI0035AB977B